MKAKISKIIIITLISLSSFYLSGCAFLKTSSVNEEHLPAFETSLVLKALDEAVEKGGVRDSQDAKIKGFPGIRVNRFLASLTENLDQEAKIKEWLSRAQKLDEEGRKIEFTNLSSSLRSELESTFGKKRLQSEIILSSDITMQTYLEYPELSSLLHQHIKVPDNYSTPARVFGIYPLSSWFVLQGLEDLQNDARTAFHEPKNKKSDSIQTYASSNPRPVFEKKKRADLLEKARKESALNIPEPNESALKLFFDYFAPVFRIETKDKNDMIGSPFWQNDETIGIDTTDPVVYRFHSFTRFGEDILLQLNYVIWYPKRPDESAFDIYSGNLDGLMWRVTLDNNGQVLLYDSVHPCGCYQKYYPVSKMLHPLDQFSQPEPPLIFSDTIPASEENPVIVHINSREHYVVGLFEEDDISNQADIRYRIEDYNQLRKLPHFKGYKSMFSPDGLVKGTERAERWLVWPMGVSSAGAMRQRGNHAIALVGRQHFDDARLLETVFQLPEK